MATDLFKEYERLLASTARGVVDEPAWLQQERSAALLRAKTVGFPGRRNELWKYTRPGRISREVLQPAGTATHAALRERVEAAALDGATARLVFVNGHFDRELSKEGSLPAGAQLVPLQEALRGEDGERLRELLVDEAPETALMALNQAFAADGAALVVDDDVEVPGVVQLIHVGLGGVDEMSNGRSVVSLGRHASASVYETFVSVGDEAPVAQQGTMGRVGDGARLRVVTLQAVGAAARRFAHQRYDVGRDSTLQLVQVATGSELSRDDLRIEQRGTGAHVDMAAVTVAGARQHIDHSTWLNHALPDGTSDQLYKYILAERAHGVFHGRINVAQDAQKTAAEQLNQNMLIDETARISTRPQLEIFADDVTCAHGATIGRLQDEEVFYLQSRGLGPEQARYLLLRGFALDVLERVEDEALRAHLHEHVEAELR